MDIKKEYKQSWKFLRECKIHILIIVLLFLASILLGFLFPIFFVDFIKKFTEEIIKKTEGLDFFQLFLFISKNNITTALIGVIAGIIFGIIPLFYAFFNGYVLGFVMNKSVSVLGIGVLWRLVPHGIFELPALVLSLGLGLKIGLFQTSANNKKKGILAFMISFMCFLVIADLILTIINLFFKINLLNMSLVTNILYSSLLFVILLVILVFSFYVGNKILDKKDRQLVLLNFKKWLENSLKVLLLIVIPLLIIAAVIETGLMFLLG